MVRNIGNRFGETFKVYAGDGIFGKQFVPATHISQRDFAELEIEFGRANKAETVGIATLERSDMSKSEREKLLRQIGGLALLLAEKSKLYKRGSKPNASQIAEAVRELAESVPDAKRRGVAGTELRTSIADGLKLLAGDDLPADN